MNGLSRQPSLLPATGLQALLHRKRELRGLVPERLLQTTVHAAVHATAPPHVLLLARQVLRQLTQRNSDTRLLLQPRKRGGHE